MHLLIDAIAAAKPFRYGTWMRQAVYRAVSPFHPCTELVARGGEDASKNVTLHKEEWED